MQRQAHAHARRILFAALLVACSSSPRNKNDDIAACNASGGRWVEGGCESPHCEPRNPMTPDDPSMMPDDPTMDPDDVDARGL